MSISHEQVQQAVGPQGWRLVGDAIQSYVATGDFAAGVRLVEGIGELADAANHHPDVGLTYPGVTITLTSHDVGDLTERDVDLALAISALVRDLGHEQHPAPPPAG